MQRFNSHVEPARLNSTVFAAPKRHRVSLLRQLDSGCWFRHEVAIWSRDPKTGKMWLVCPRCGDASQAFADKYPAGESRT
jgi:hypothetical protein